VVNLITFYAQEVRETSGLHRGAVAGRGDRARRSADAGQPGSAHLDDLDLNPMLITVDGADRIVYDRYKPRNAVPIRWTPRS
jgi:glutamate synthase (NADPH/NADH) large chain